MVWKIANAKSQFSELIHQAYVEPQFIYNREKPSAVVMSFEEYNRLRNLDILYHKPPKWANFVAFSEGLIQETGLADGLELPTRDDREIDVFN